MSSRLHLEAIGRCLAAGSVCLLSAAILMGCSSQGTPQGDVSELALQPAGGGGGSDSALLEGVVHREGGCTFVERDSGERVVLVFQAGDASWVGDDLVFTGAAVDVGSVKAGDTLALAGSAFQGGVTDEMTIPDGCRAFTQFWNVPSD